MASMTFYLPERPKNATNSVAVKEKIVLSHTDNIHVAVNVNTPIKCWLTIPSILVSFSPLAKINEYLPPGWLCMGAV